MTDAALPPDPLREALERLVLVALPVWNDRIVDNYLRREGFAAIEQARAALAATPPIVGRPASSPPNTPASPQLAPQRTRNDRIQRR